MTGQLRNEIWASKFWYDLSLWEFLWDIFYCNRSQITKYTACFLRPNFHVSKRDICPMIRPGSYVSFVQFHLLCMTSELGVTKAPFVNFSLGDNTCYVFELHFNNSDVTTAKLWQYMLTHWGREKMAAVSQTLYSNAFSWMKMYEFHLKFHRSFYLTFQLTIFQHWLKGLRPVLEGFVVPMHEGACETRSQIPRA